MKTKGRTLIEKRSADYYALVHRVPASSVEDLQSIPGLTYINGEVRGGPDVIAAAARRLKLTGLDLPAPIHSTVDRKISKQYGLRPFQSSGVGTMVSRLEAYKGGILADDMGLGKTRQAIVVAELLGCKGNLVVVPASVRDQWAREIKSITGCGSVVSLGPITNRKHQNDWDVAPTSSWVICSYALLDKVIMHSFADRYPAALIMDEFHLVKGRKADRSRLVKSVGGLARYRLGTTGTPIWDTPRDLWKQLDIILPGRFSNSGYAFDLAYCHGHHGDHGFDNRGVSNAEELRERLDFYMLRREKREVAKDLPKFSRRFVWLDGTPKATAAMNSSMMSPGDGSMYRALSATLEDKIPAVVELALSARRFVIFTWEKKHAKEIAETIVRGGLQCGLITGDYSVRERDRSIRDAQSGGYGLVCTIDAAGTGVDGLQHVASTEIFHAIDWVPRKLMQAEARLDRIGQTEPVEAIYVGLRDSMDEVVCHTVVKKLDMQHQVLGGDRGPRDAIDGELAASVSKGDSTLLSSIYEKMNTFGTDDIEDWDDAD